MAVEIIHKELSYVVNGCIFDVHNEVGPGLREECYQKAMEHRLAQEGLPLVAKPHRRRELVYCGQIVDVFEPDLLVCDQLILELKSQRDGLAGENFAQILSYLKCWDLRLGLLVNFGESLAVIERVPYTPAAPVVVQNYDFIRDHVTDDLRPTLRTIRQSLLDINSEFGTGYPETTCRKLVEVALRNRGLACLAQAGVTPVFRERQLPYSQVIPLVVENSVLVDVQALHEDISATAVRTVQTFLRFTGCRLGLIASFGKTRFEIRGVHP